MDLAKEKVIALMFMDASHFVMGCDFLGSIYGKVRRFMRTSSGRKRYNVLGALNFLTKKLTTVTNDTYITSTQVCDLLRRPAIEYAGLPLYIVLDNASCQKCFLVQNLAKELGINLVYIPPYSPNLNLIERYWKFVKSKLRIQYYSVFDVFRNRIDDIVDAADNKHKKDLDKLISEKVQFFDALLKLEAKSAQYKTSSFKTVA
jgi:transposase